MALQVLTLKSVRVIDKIVPVKEPIPPFDEAVTV